MHSHLGLTPVWWVREAPAGESALCLSELSGETRQAPKHRTVLPIRQAPGLLCGGRALRYSPGVVSLDKESLR